MPSLGSRYRRPSTTWQERQEAVRSAQRASWDRMRAQVAAKYTKETS